MAEYILFFAQESLCVTESSTKHLVGRSCGRNAKGRQQVKLLRSAVAKMDASRNVGVYSSRKPIGSDVCNRVKTEQDLAASWHSVVELLVAQHNVSPSATESHGKRRKFTMLRSRT